MHHPITDWRDTYLLAGIQGMTVKQARAELKFWNIDLPDSLSGARRTLRLAGLTISGGRVIKARKH